MPSFYVTLGLLSLVGSALGHTRHQRPSGWRGKGKGRYGSPTGTGLPFPAGNETGIWGTGTGTGYPTGYYPTATGSAPYFYETAVSSVVADGEEQTTTSTWTTSSTVYVTMTNTFTVTVAPEETASETASSAGDYERRAVTWTRGGRRTRTRQFGAPVPTATVDTPTARAVGSGKRGLAYNNAALCAGFSSNLITWGYNWAQTSGGLNSKFQFVPMLWGTASMFTNGWASTASAYIANGGTHLLAFNEPDHAQQANMAPGTAAAAYKTHMQPFAGKAKLGSPAVTNGGGAMGLNWLTSFMSACQGCTIDFVAVHWYDSVNNVEYFKKHITDAHTKTGKPVWLTEFGTIDGSDADKANFLRQVLPWLDAQSFVERYAYFMVAEGMMTSGGQVAAAYAA